MLSVSIAHASSPAGGAYLTKQVKEVTVAFVIIISLLMLVPAISGAKQDVQIISGSPGDDITFHGVGTPNSDVKLTVTTTVAVDSGGSGQSGKRNYYIELNNIAINSGSNSFSISVYPVESATITGTAYSLGGLSLSRDLKVSGESASISQKNIPAGKYKVVLSGDTNAAKVHLDVTASSTVHVGSDGKYSYYVDTQGMPEGKYTIQQGGIDVGIVYLGVPSPPVSTPVPTPKPTCTPTPPGHGNCNGKIPKQCLDSSDFGHWKN
jgi:hypothetical protein